MAVRDHSFTDDFRADTAPGARWVAPARILDFVAAGPDGLQLSAQGAPGRLLTRVRDRHWHATATIQVESGAGGVILRLDSIHWCELRVENGRARAIAHLSGFDVDLGSVECDPGDVELRMTSVAPPWIARFPPTPPDVIRFALVRDGVETPLGELDGRYVSTQVAGGFTGRMIGVFAQAGRSVVRSFRYASSLD